MLFRSPVFSVSGGSCAELENFCKRFDEFVSVFMDVSSNESQKS